MVGDDAPRQAESEAKAAACFAAGEERIEEMGLFAGGEAGAVVGNCDFEEAIAVLSVDWRLDVRPARVSSF